MSLPYNATILNKHDLLRCRPMFALYLDIQKRIDIETLSPDELRGRWKSFTGKWNRGELAEGWYDPQTLAKAQAREQQEQQQSPITTNRKRKRKSQDDDEDDNDNDSASDEDFGPPPPSSSHAPTSTHATQLSVTSATRPGPTIPNTSDLQSHHDTLDTLSQQARAQQSHLHHLTLKAAHAQTQSNLEDLLPRAAPGTRDRQLEKKRDLAASNRAFAAAKDAGGDVEVRDSELLGGEGDLAELKRARVEQDRKKNEREIRREEFLRARMAEREEKMRVRQEKEDRTMDMLRDLARQRFG